MAARDFPVDTASPVMLRGAPPGETADERAQREQRRLSRAVRHLPYAGLVACTVFAWLTRDIEEIRRAPLGVSVAVAAGTAGWMWWLMTAHPGWQRRRGLMAVYFAGFVALSAVLIATNPLYGFFAWTGYMMVVYALTGGWQLLGAAAVGVVSAVSQVGGLHVAASREGLTPYLVLVVFNVAVGVAMTRLSSVTDAFHERRGEMLEELAEANRKLAEAMEENAGLHAQLLVQAREAGVLDERQRLAGEIHDVLAQGLTGIVTQLEAADQAAGRPPTCTGTWMSPGGSPATASPRPAARCTTCARAPSPPRRCRTR